MALSLDEVRHVAHLARLHLEEDELVTMQQQLSAILEYVDMLQEADISKVDITAQVTDVVNVVRPDVVEPSLPIEVVLAQAGSHEGSYFKVKPVFE
ncbi:MAG: Asp-tRNA(Asn)/Glu-tRNA(Gln) amidotransferase subunit GatC [Herpetosiphon sp.]